MRGSRWLHNHCCCCYKSGMIDYSKNNYNPIMTSSMIELWLKVNKTPAKTFAELPSPDDWLAKLKEMANDS